MTDLARIPALITAAGLLIGGVIEAPDPGLSAALFGAGFITLGAWLTLETAAHLKRKDTRRGDKEGP